MPQTVAAGGSVLFTIGAFDGYHVADVLVDGVSVGARTSYEFTNVQADHTISATFAADSVRTFTITPSAGANGWIGPPLPQTVAAGGSVLFTIGAFDGYHVADVLVDGLSVGARTSYEFTNVQADHTISATFAADSVRTFTIRPSAGANGWIGPPLPQTVAAGGSVLFTIGAFDGYHVADVLVDGLSVGARTSYEFTNVQADHTISATFVADAGQTFKITPSAGEHGVDRPADAAERRSRRESQLRDHCRPRLPRRRRARRRPKRRRPHLLPVHQRAGRPHDQRQLRGGHRTDGDDHLAQLAGSCGVAAASKRSAGPSARPSRADASRCGPPHPPASSRSSPRRERP